jgi:hypothetical protein
MVNSSKRFIYIFNPNNGGIPEFGVTEFGVRSLNIANPNYAYYVKSPIS